MLLPAAPATAQRADSLLRAGDVAARDSRHDDAIAFYEQAAAADSTLRVALLPKLGRQHLWRGESRTATLLFARYLAAHPDDCETWSDLARAQSWSGALGAARASYHVIQGRCPGAVHEARLGEALVLRWANRPSAAARLYRVVLDSAPAPLRARAAIGLAYVHADRAEPRRAAALFDSLLAAGVEDAAVFEGRAMTAWDLGDRGAARDLATRADAGGVRSEALHLLRQRLDDEDDGSVAPALRHFRDRDGTRYTARELAGGFGFGRSGGAELLVRRAELRAGGVALAADEAQLAVRARPSPALALSAGATVRRWEGLDAAPLGGEANAAFLPNDRQRIDLAVARIVPTDNLAAVRAGLAGTFGSAGISQRVTTRTSIVLGGDVTRWNEGNTRWRARAALQHRFEGLPSVTLEWPTAIQRYDAPFSFGFFSPRRYVETGPAATVYRRLWRTWHLSAYGRAGALRETGGSWQPLGVTRASVEREVRAHWGVRADAGWSNSNLAGSAGFQRTSFSLQLTGRL